MIRNFEEGVVERIGDSLGTRLLEFILNADVEALATGTISGAQRTHVHELDALQRKLSETQQLGGEIAREALRVHMTDVSQGTQPKALAIHRACGGLIETPETSDDLEAAIVALARDVYPMLLLPIEDSEMLMMNTTSIRAMIALIGHPENERFQGAALADPVLSKIFAEDRPHVGRSAMVYRSTFQGSDVQLSMLASLPLRAAWRERPDDEPPGLTDFMKHSLEKWWFIKSALAGKKQQVRARVAFAGVRLPDNRVQIDFGEAIIRNASPSERTLAPESIRGQLVSTDADGNSVTVNFEGDLVAEIDQPYSAKVDKRSMDDSSSEFPPDLITENPVEDAVLRLRLALVLGVSRQHRVQIVPTWRLIDDPLNYGYNMAWGDAKQAINLVPTQLTPAEVESWSHWHSLLTEQKADKLNLTISRVVRAIGERRDPVDVLIDSVIAWENLFGSKEGEPTLRVTASLALLLEDDYTKRRKLRTRLAKIYALRSDAVHGTAAPSGDDIALCHEALDVATKALHAILAHRPDLLAEPDSTSRSLRLLLGAPAPGHETIDT